MENYVTLSDCGKRQRENSRCMSLRIKYSRPEPIDWDSPPKRDKNGRPLKKKFWERVRRRRESIKGKISQTKAATQTLAKYQDTLTKEQKENYSQLKRYFPLKKHKERGPVDMSSLVPVESKERRICKIMSTNDDSLVRLALAEKPEGKGFYCIRVMEFPDCEAQWLKKEQWLKEQGYGWIL